VAYSPHSQINVPSVVRLKPKIQTSSHVAKIDEQIFLGKLCKTLLASIYQLLELSYHMH